MLPFTLQKAAAQNCKTEPLSSLESMSPEKLAEFVKTNSIDSVEEFVCCLPEKFRSNYLVGMSSIAAQNGTPDSPRIIMSDSELSKPASYIISFNGGKNHNFQKNNIEMIFLNPKSKELELFDLDFSDRNMKIHKNPGICMNCHGENAKMPAGGPKYIFDTFDFWPRFAGGVSHCNETETKIHNLMADRAIKAVQTEKRFNCLDKNVLKVEKDKTVPRDRYPKLSSNLANFDNSNERQNLLRSSRWLSQQSDYNQFKYFLFGYANCNSKNFNEWMPESRVKKLFSNVSLTEDLRNSGPLKENFNIAYKKAVRQFKVGSQMQKEKMADPENLFKTGHIPNYSAMACSEEAPQINFEMLGFTAKDFSAKTPRLLLYLDRQLRANPTGQSIPGDHLRIYMEGTNKPLGIISTSMGNGVSTFIRGGANVLIGLEPSDSRLAELFGPVPKGLPPSTDKMIIGEFDGEKNYDLASKLSLEETCAELKKLSFEALNGSGKRIPKRESQKGKTKN